MGTLFQPPKARPEAAGVYQRTSDPCKGWEATLYSDEDVQAGQLLVAVADAKVKVFDGGPEPVVGFALTTPDRCEFPVGTPICVLVDGCMGLPFDPSDGAIGVYVWTTGPNQGFVTDNDQGGQAVLLPNAMFTGAGEVCIGEASETGTPPSETFIILLEDRCIMLLENDCNHLLEAAA